MTSTFAIHKTIRTINTLFKNKANEAELKVLEFEQKLNDFEI